MVTLGSIVWIFLLSVLCLAAVKWSTLKDLYWQHFEAFVTEEKFAAIMHQCTSSTTMTYVCVIVSCLYTDVDNEHWRDETQRGSATANVRQSRRSETLSGVNQSRGEPAGLRGDAVSIVAGDVSDERPVRQVVDDGTQLHCQKWRVDAWYVHICDLTYCSARKKIWQDLTAVTSGRGTGDMFPILYVLVLLLGYGNLNIKVRSIDVWPRHTDVIRLNTRYGRVFTLMTSSQHP